MVCGVYPGAQIFKAYHGCSWSAIDLMCRLILHHSWNSMTGSSTNQNADTWYLRRLCPFQWWHPLDRELHGRSICTLCGNLHHTWKIIMCWSEAKICSYVAGVDSPCFAVAPLECPVTGGHRQTPGQKKQKQQPTAPHLRVGPSKASNSLSSYGRSHSKPEVSRLIIESTRSSSEPSFSSLSKSPSWLVRSTSSRLRSVSSWSRSPGSEQQVFTTAPACHLLARPCASSFVFRTCNTIIRTVNVMAVGCMVTGLSFDFESKVD